MEFLTTAQGLILMIIGFGLLIFVHELGHFLAAKWAGIRTEAFAIGMGPVICAWRKGIGLTFGSTEKKVVALTEKKAADLKDDELARHGLGETEYSLRWLPIGGFVKMLGQEDLNPNYQSSDPRSYNVAPVGKRMIVVSAGVIMNLILAAVLFVIAFMAGVRFEAPVVGTVIADMPAARTAADNAQELGITEPGLMPGDWVENIDGDTAETFADIQIASAMSRPGVPVRLAVRRDGYDKLLRFTLEPTPDDAVEGMRAIGIDYGRSLTLIDKVAEIGPSLEALGLTAQGVEPGMTMVEANDRRVDTLQQVQRIARSSGGGPISTVWTRLDEDGERFGEPVTASVDVSPELQQLVYPTVRGEGQNDYEIGLLGITPLTQVREVLPDSPNRDVLRPGDIILTAGDLEGPRQGDLIATISQREAGPVNLLLLRDGNEVEVTATVERTGLINRRSMIGVALVPAIDVPLIAAPMNRVGDFEGEEKTLKPIDSPIAPLNLFPRTRFVAIGDTSVDDWRGIWEAFRAQTLDAYEAHEPASVEITVVHPVGDGVPVTLTFDLSAADIKNLHELGWQCELGGYLFEPIYTVRSAGGNPLTAIAMGLEETKKMLVMTYLTLDRLVRRTVSVRQLRGPVGIVHIGTRIVDRGFMYLIFFLAMISVNLAVINFLPLPIVDGGLFLFLVYEKFKGKPPSVRFQEFATIAGLALIATVFIVVTFNDVVRLFS